MSGKDVDGSRKLAEIGESSGLSKKKSAGQSQSKISFKSMKRKHEQLDKETKISSVLSVSSTVADLKAGVKRNDCQRYCNVICRL